MSQNKYMHPRNIYRNRPNFKELAISYPEFRKFAKQVIRSNIEYLWYIDSLLINIFCTRHTYCDLYVCPVIRGLGFHMVHVLF